MACCLLGELRLDRGELCAVRACANKQTNTCNRTNVHNSTRSDRKSPNKTDIIMTTQTRRNLAWLVVCWVSCGWIVESCAQFVRVQTSKQRNQHMQQNERTQLDTIRPQIAQQNQH